MTPLTAHERHVLYALGRLGSMKAVADELGMAPQTVKNVLHSVHRKLGTRSSIQCLWLVLGEAWEREKAA